MRGFHTDFRLDFLFFVPRECLAESPKTNRTDRPTDRQTEQTEQAGQTEQTGQTEQNRQNRQNSTEQHRTGGRRTDDGGRRTDDGWTPLLGKLKAAAL